MDSKQIFSWCMERVNLGRRYDWFGDRHYKITFENGDCYEWRRDERGPWRYVVTVWINGAMVARDLLEDGWLPSGAYGVKLIERLPIETAA